jgi:3'-5' exonuclease
MVHGISAPGLVGRAYYHRFTDDTTDFFNSLSSYGPGAKAKLDGISRIMGLDGKLDGMTGADVESYFRQARIKEISDYCRSDVTQHLPAFAQVRTLRWETDQDAVRSE